MKKRILFVDDDPQILTMLERMLEGMRSEWDMDFIDDGAKALKLMFERPYDAILSDVRMPGMNGAELLGLVSQSYPHTVRIVMSAYSDRDTTLRLVGTAHQFIAKPFDFALLRDTLSNALAMDDLRRNEPLQRLIERLQPLPALPEFYLDLLAELRYDEPSPTRMMEILSNENDLFLHLQEQLPLARPDRLKSGMDPREILARAGPETIKATVLHLRAFAHFDRIRLRECTPQDLRDHCWRTGILARQIALDTRQKESVCDGSFAAGLLHDLGKLILTAGVPADYQSISRREQGTGVPAWRTEQDVLGADHGQVGACLLAHWGLPGPIVEAVAWHHHPASDPRPDFSPVTAVHIANFLDHEGRHPKATPSERLPDLDYLTRLGLAEQLGHWRQNHRIP
jgi:response regulator RpfG family c-di-GMP phosphodiesterase